MSAAIFSVVYALAVARFTVLITQDKITERPRLWFLRRQKEDSLLAYLVVCQWCVSFWVSLVAAPLTWVYGGLGRVGESIGVSAWLGIPALVFAYSGFTGYLSKFAEE